MKTPRVQCRMCRVCRAVMGRAQPVGAQSAEECSPCGATCQGPDRSHSLCPVRPMVTLGVAGPTTEHLSISYSRTGAQSLVGACGVRPPVQRVAELACDPDPAPARVRRLRGLQAGQRVAQVARVV